MKWANRLLGAVMVACCAGTSSWADATNLVTSPTAPTSNPHQVPGWIFSMWNLKDNPTEQGKVDGTIDYDTDALEMLTIASTESIPGLQMWWQTTDKIACTGGSVFQLSVSVKGALKGGTVRPTIGLYFYDAAGKWISYQDITQDPTIPAAWQKVVGKVTAPGNAVSLGVRLGVVYADGDASVSYKSVVLTPSSP